MEEMTRDKKELVPIIISIISLLVSIFSAYVNYNSIIETNKNVYLQITNSNKPMLSLKSSKYFDADNDFIFDYNKKYDEYKILLTRDLNIENRAFLGYLPINLELENNGNGTLYDLKMYSLDNSNQPSFVDKKNILEIINAKSNFKRNIFNGSISDVNISPINISANSKIENKVILLHRQSLINNNKNFYSQCLAICFYHDIDDNVYSALLEISYNIPSNSTEDIILEKDDNLQILSCGIYQENTIDYRNYVEDTSIKNEIEKYKLDYISGWNSTN